MKASSRRLLLPVASFVFGLLVLGGAFFIAEQSRQPGASTVSSIGGPFKLVDGKGRIYTDADFRGEPTIVFFGYTHCPDICPTTLSALSSVLGKMDASEHVAVLFITVDPERDTPAVMQDYVSNFDPRIIGLSGDRPAIDAVMKAYHVYAKKVPTEGNDYSMDHSAVVYLMDKNGRFATALDLERKPEEVAASLSRYM